MFISSPESLFATWCKYLLSAHLTMGDSVNEEHSCMSSAVKRHLLIGCTGSVASIKLPEIIQEFKKIAGENVEIRVVVTQYANHFFKESDLPNSIEVFNDEDEWKAWNSRGDPVLHIELGKWADLMVIAPLDANTLAKIAQGLCDNLLTCVVRAWDMKKHLLFCPAMNTRMWNHPITSKHISVLKSWGYCEIPPISKTLMCGDKGIGAMAEVSTIVQRVQDCFLNMDNEYYHKISDHLLVYASLLSFYEPTSE
ncbi:Putative phosphopentothenoylcysteine decarboxylase, partial [Gryllus bimaculatus]